MVKSMTGFGRSDYSDEKRNIIVEIKAVNHRYAEISVRIPRRYAFAEEKVKSIVKETARRGKIEVSIIVENTAGDDSQIKLNISAAKKYYENLMELKQSFPTDGSITLEFLASLPDVLKTIPDIEDEEEFINALSVPLRQAVQRLDEMRRIEGEKLHDDISMRADILKKITDNIDERAPAVSIEYRDRMKNRIRELTEGAVEIPEDRILLEAAIFADKSNITEEIVRLNSHILQLKKIINESDKPDGKKLDFLIQEMNRETNTIGSKANDLEITSYVLDLKSEIEKIREQVQNIE